MLTLYRTCVVLLAVVSIHGDIPLPPGAIQCPSCQPQHNWFHRPMYGGCQEYDVKAEFGRLYYSCRSYSEKSGKCPSNTTQFELAPNGYLEVQCLGDWFCPPGFKCCKEDSVKGVHICKKAEMDKEEEPNPAAQFPPAARTPSNTPKNNKPPAKPAPGPPPARGSPPAPGSPPRLGPPPPAK